MFSFKDNYEQSSKERICIPPFSVFYVAQRNSLETEGINRVWLHDVEAEKVHE